jgi:hypothetical protein
MTPCGAQLHLDRSNTRRCIDPSWRWRTGTRIPGMTATASRLWRWKTLDAATGWHWTWRSHRCCHPPGLTLACVGAVMPALSCRTIAACNCISERARRACDSLSLIILQPDYDRVYLDACRDTVHRYIEAVDAMQAELRARARNQHIATKLSGAQIQVRAHSALIPVTRARRRRHSH